MTNQAEKPCLEAPVEPGSVDKNRAFQLDRKFYPITGPMTGHELMGLLGNPPDHELWKRGSGEPDRKIALDDVVDIRPGCRLYSAPRFVNNSVEPGSEPPPNWREVVDEATRTIVALKAERDALKADVKTLREWGNINRDDANRLATEKIALKAERDAQDERARMVDTAISVLSLSNTPESLAANRLPRDNPYWTVSNEDVAKAMEREIKLIAERDTLAAQVKRHEEDEAANCPEDQSCIETIKALRRKLEMVHAAHIEDFVPCEQCGNCLTCDPHTHRADGTRESESSAIRARRKESEARRAD